MSDHGGELARIESANRRRTLRDSGDRYTHFNAANLRIIQERERHLLEALRREGLYPLAGRDLLEVGCGSGYWLREFVHWGADPERLTGIELAVERVAKARERLPATVRVLQGDACDTGLPDASFDLVFQSTVFTSILDPAVRRALAQEMLRLVRPGGIVVWYDFRYDNPRNPDVRGVGLREIRRLFPGCRVRSRTLTLAPFLARRVAPWAPWLYPLLAAVPPLRTHRLAVVRRRPPASPTTPR